MGSDWKDGFQNGFGMGLGRQREHFARERVRIWIDRLQDFSLPKGERIRYNFSFVCSRALPRRDTMLRESGGWSIYIYLIGWNE
jgi:hypothetical protein